MTNPTYYIHNKYIATGGWQQTTWDWLMGQIGKNGWTLVNVVAEIWNVVSTTIDKVKSVATDVWNGIKTAGEFIANSLLLPIVKEIQRTMILVLKTIVILLKEYININISDLNDGMIVTLHGLQLKFQFKIGSDLSVRFFLNDYLVQSVKVPYYYPLLEIETLSLSSEDTIGTGLITSTSDILGLLAVSMLITGTGATPNWPEVWMINLLSVIFQITTQLIPLASYSAQDAKDYTALLAQTHLTAGTAHFFWGFLFESMSGGLIRHVAQEFLQEVVITLMSFTFGQDVTLSNRIMGYFNMNYKSLFFPIVVAYFSAWAMATGKLLVSDVGGIQNIPTYGSASSIMHFALGIILMVDAHYS